MSDELKDEFKKLNEDDLQENIVGPMMIGSNKLWMMEPVDLSYWLHWFVIQVLKVGNTYRHTTTSR